jgi:hypothetical protein
MIYEKLKTNTNNIFLYEAVLSTIYGQIPVTQMLSESHDTLTVV